MQKVSRAIEIKHLYVSRDHSFFGHHGKSAGDAPMIEVPEAHHHLFLDQPLAFATALRALLADWTTPPRPR